MHDRFDPEYDPYRQERGLTARRQGGLDVYRPPHDGFGDEDGGSGEDGFDFWGTVRILLGRKWMILAITLIGVIASALMTLQVVPLYRATATIEVQRQETQILDQNAVDPVVIADAEYMQTQYALLQSRSLAERVSEVLNLPADERYASPDLNRQERLNQAAGTITNNIRVTPEGRSRVINVQFVSPYPREAARIANALVENFIETNLERKYNTTAYARRFLEERLATTKLALESSERQLTRYANDKGILELNTENGSGSLDANSLVALSSELTAAESARIAAEQRFREASSGTATRDMLESSNLQNLRDRRSELAADYRQMLGTFKPEYPDMLRLQSQIDAIDAEIEAARGDILASIRSDYNTAVANEASLRERVETLKTDLQALRDRRIEYTILRREVDTNRSQYEALLQRMKEVTVASGIGSSQVSVVDRALVPKFPFEPNLRRALIQALILSLAAGIGLAFALHYIDDTIKTPEDVKSKLGLASIGVVPKIKRASEDLITSELNNPRSPVSEAFLSARTALDFTTETGAPRSLLVTSTRPGEGKTSSTVALGISFAKGGRRVLIIDADMRKPSFVADAGASIGLSGMLTREANLLDQIVRSGVEGLHLLPAGIVPPNPAELLTSPKLKQILHEAETHFDLVIVDSPPVLSFTDAPLLGSMCAGTIVIIQAGLIRTPAVRRTVGRMLDSRANVLGVMLTKFDARKAGQGYGGYYYYAYGKDAYAYSERALSDSSSTRRKVRLFLDGETDVEEERIDI